ncbi:MAG: 23S rRNA (pseudouridine(1915)-N(3))-methyltransferase RlmH [Candidatus Woesebacteria bacterium]|jgi:23S rRNA (pseudouridine1915-N3)-methyltransferase
MKILLLAIGKQHDSALANAINSYTTRLQHYCQPSWRLVGAAKGKIALDVARKLESDTIRAEIAPSDYVVLLDERGKQISSPELAKLLEARQQQTSKRVVIIIGGAYGVDDDLRKRADFVWSLSRLVFPHQLVRLILAEQLYRTFSIIKGEPYHHQ